MAKITKVRVAENMMAGFFAKRRGESVEMVDAWNVEGETDQRPYDIQTRDEDSAVKYAAAMDAGDDDLIERLMEASAARYAA